MGRDESQTKCELKDINDDNKIAPPWQCIFPPVLLAVMKLIFPYGK